MCHKRAALSHRKELFQMTLKHRNLPASPVEYTLKMKKKNARETEEKEIKHFSVIVVLV